jgi:DNA-directed RNA polymerase
MRSPDPTKYMCHTPVAQDGTCNGLQHYAALGGDKEGARQVNLQPSDRPQDVYTGVAELVKARIEVDVAAGHPIAKILQGHITRKVVKQSVMTNVYGVTFVGARQQIQKQLEDNPEIPRKEVVKCAAYVARLVFSSIKEVFTGATKIQHWLAMSARMISRSVSPAQYEMLDDHTNGTIKNQDSAHARRKGKVEFMTSVVWTTPLKMAVVQPYRNETSVVVQTNLQKIYISDPSAIDEVNSRKQMTAFPPNFIHSLDATHMLLSAVKCAENGITFAAVHDSFWTHPGQVDNLNRILRDAFVNLHSVDIMEKLKDEFETRYKGYKYLVSIPAHSEIAKLIKMARKKYATEVLGKPQGLTVVEDLQWELKRDKLLASEDPAERELGENMLTPSVILNRAGGASAVEIKESLGGGLGAIDNKRTESVDKDVFSDGGDDIPSAADAPEVLEADQAEHMELDNVEAHEEAIHAEAAVEEAIEEAEDLEEEEAPKPKKKRVGNTGTVAVWMPLVFPPLPAKVCHAHKLQHPHCPDRN